jgi:hypothetical protein
MDIYLPADFHALHDAAADDWRDVSSTSTARARTEPSVPGPDVEISEPGDGCADPTWRVL